MLQSFALAAKSYSDKIYKRDAQEKLMKDLVMDNYGL